MCLVLDLCFTQGYLIVSLNRNPFSVIPMEIGRNKPLPDLHQGSLQDHDREPTVIEITMPYPELYQQNKAWKVQYTMVDPQDQQPICGEIKWISNFAPLVVTIAGFGGSITFTVFPALENPPYSNLTAQEARTYLSLAWLLFMIALYVGCYASVSMDKDGTRRSGRSAYFCFALLSFVLQLSVVLPFFFLSHVVRGFSPPVGAVGLGCTGFVLLLILVNSVFKVVGKCTTE